jgi:hypothetical protein
VVDRVTRLNRHLRRAHGARIRREERRELSHVCAVEQAQRSAGVVGRVPGVTVVYYHDLHRVLGEPTCPRCPRCLWLRRVGRIDRKPQDPAATLETWRQLLEARRQLHEVPCREP